jgi:endonuclease YncB( thermonuclease family)
MNCGKWIIATSIIAAGCIDRPEKPATATNEPVTVAYRPSSPATTARPEAPPTAPTEAPERPGEHDLDPPPRSLVERTWRDRAGNHEMRAVLLDVVDGIARLQKPDKIVRVPVHKLSDDDFAYISATGIKHSKPRELIGKVVKIKDGDTLVVLDENNQQHTIRLAGIDAPESKQAFGQRAKEALSDKVFGKTVRVDWRHLDKYGRTIGDIYVDDRWINKEMIQEGFAWHYRRYSNSAELADAESSARGSRLGLWNAKTAEPPWEYRHKEKDRAQASKAYKPTPTKPKPKSDFTPNTTDRDNTVYTGPRGGHYHLSPSGNKVYEGKN